jgi:hypothetical protein
VKRGVPRGWVASFEIIKFKNCSLGTDRPSNYPQDESRWKYLFDQVGTINKYMPYTTAPVVKMIVISTIKIEFSSAK